MEYENFDVEHASGIAWVTIDTTSKYNALNAAMADEFLDLATKLGEDESVRCVALTGSGNAFCGGADLGMFAEGHEATDIRKVASTAHDAVVQLHYAEKPIVAGVNGIAIGAGLSFAILADLVVVSEDAFLQYGFPQVGLPGDSGATFYLPRLVGLRRAKEIAMLNEPIQPEEAVDLGLASETAPAEEFDERFREMVERVASGPTFALGTAKRLLETSFERSLPSQLAAETDGMARGSYTDDHEEGVEAFLEDRQPTFTGQ